MKKLRPICEKCGKKELPTTNENILFLVREDTNQGVSNKAVLNKLLKLLEELAEHPFTGTGKPEALKHDLAGYWSRRINKEHRLVYEVSENQIFILSAKGHY